MAWSDFSPPYIAGVGSSPSRRGPLRHKANGSEMRPPRFRCDPFARDVAFDPGRASAPRIAAPHILPSSEQRLSAPAISDLSWLNPTPHAITVYASQPLSPATTQHSLPSGRYSLLGPDLHRQDRTSFAWRTSRYGRSLLSAPRTEPYVRLPRIRHPPRVCDGENVSQSDWNVFVSRRPVRLPRATAK